MLACKFIETMYIASFEKLTCITHNNEIENSYMIAVGNFGNMFQPSVSDVTSIAGKINRLQRSIRVDNKVGAGMIDTREVTRINIVLP